ncbi:MAG: endonuclease V [Candidatus Hydrothermarchaeota archaeon]
MNSSEKKTDFDELKLNKLNLNRLKEYQEELSKKIIIEDLFDEINVIGGVDVSYYGNTAFVSSVFLSFEKLEVLDCHFLSKKIDFPYIPTFLAFREAEPIKDVIKNSEFDILLIDGHGIAHPRRVGIASHIGAEMNIPTIGVAKKPLFGYYKEPKEEKEANPIKVKEETVGYAFKSKCDSRPIFISPGHGVSLKSSLEIVKRCIVDHRLPEPLRIADEISKKIRNIWKYYQK